LGKVRGGKRKENFVKNNNERIRKKRIIGKRELS
jgi:hypothetical protein